jgi:hypothetical protein
MESIIKPAQLDLSQITFSDLKKLDLSKSVYVNHKKNKIMLQTPQMSTISGIKHWKDDKYPEKFDLQLSFYGEDGTDKNAEELRIFKKKVQDLDTLIKEKIIENCKPWLGLAKLDMDSLENLVYKPMVREAVDKDGNPLPYPPSITVKLDREKDRDDNFTGRFMSNKRYNAEVLIFDENKERVELNEKNAEDVVPKGSKVISVLELSALSIVNGKVYIKWKLVQAKVFANKGAITEYAMLDDEEVQQDDLDTDLDKEVPEVEAESDNEEVQEESNEEESEAEVEKPKAAPVKAAPKSRVKRSVPA